MESFAHSSVRPFINDLQNVLDFFDPFTLSADLQHGIHASSLIMSALWPTLLPLMCKADIICEGPCQNLEVTALRVEFYAGAGLDLAVPLDGGQVERRPVGVVVDAARDAAFVEPGPVGGLVVRRADQADRAAACGGAQGREVSGGAGSDEAAADHGELVHQVGAGHSFKIQRALSHLAMISRFVCFIV